MDIPEQGGMDTADSKCHRFEAHELISSLPFQLTTDPTGRSKRPAFFVP